MTDFIVQLGPNMVSTVIVIALAVGANIASRHVGNKQIKMGLAKVADLLSSSNRCPVCGAEKECPHCKNGQTESTDGVHQA